MTLPNQDVTKSPAKATKTKIESNQINSTHLEPKVQLSDPPATPSKEAPTNVNQPSENLQVSSKEISKLVYTSVFMLENQYYF